jgi:hypothetical protein
MIKMFTVEQIPFRKGHAWVARKVHRKQSYIFHQCILIIYLNIRQFVMLPYNSPTGGNLPNGLSLGDYNPRGEIITGGLAPLGALGSTLATLGSTGGRRKRCPQLECPLQRPTKEDHKMKKKTSKCKTQNARDNLKNAKKTPV